MWRAGYTPAMTGETDMAALIARRKRIAFRAAHRGFKEVDLIFGGFAAAEGDSLSETELDQFEALLDAPDLDVYSWFIGAEPVPPAFDTPLFLRMQRFLKHKDLSWNA